MTRDLNIVIMNEWFEPDLCDRLFNPMEWNEVIDMREDGKHDVLDFLVELSVFKSKSQARKNWKGPVEIPDGFTDLQRLGKERHRLTIWKPIKCE